MSCSLKSNDCESFIFPGVPRSGNAEEEVATQEQANIISSCYVVGSEWMTSGTIFFAGL
jgi:hypothetical protein